MTTFPGFLLTYEWHTDDQWFLRGPKKLTSSNMCCKGDSFVINVRDAMLTFVLTTPIFLSKTTCFKSSVVFDGR